MFTIAETKFDTNANNKSAYSAIRRLKLPNNKSADAEILLAEITFSNIVICTNPKQ